MKKRLLQASFFALLIALFSACELEKLSSPEDLQNAGVTIEENANAELNVIKVFENVNNFGFAGDVKAVNTGDPEVSWDEFTMTMDFTNVDNASGKIIVAFSGDPVYSTGLSAAVTFDGYMNDGTGMDGELLLEIEELIQDVRIRFAMESVGDLTITEGSSSYLWSCDQTILWETGFDTLANSSDDEFILNGTAVQTLDGEVNEMTLTDIIYASSCDYLLDGELLLVKNAGTDEELTVTSDFGVGETDDVEGACDGWVLLTTNSLTLKIDMASY